VEPYLGAPSFAATCEDQKKGLWALASVSHAVAFTAMAVGIARFALGPGEPFHVQLALKILF
jgi:hypothetical protein